MAVTKVARYGGVYHGSADTVEEAAAQLVRELENDQSFPLSIETADGVVHWAFDDSKPRDEQLDALHKMASTDRSAASEHGRCAEQAEYDRDALRAALARLVAETERSDCPGLYGVSTTDDAYVKARDLLAALAVPEARQPHEHCHDLVCNGDRRFPRGVVGHCCSCLSRAKREAAEPT